MLSEKNKEAIKSSVLVGIAEGAFLGGIFFVNDKGFETVIMAVTVGFVLGLTIGLMTTWYNED